MTLMLIFILNLYMQNNKLMAKFIVGMQIEILY